MVTEKDILDMYTHLRATNQTISDEALEFMRWVCLSKLNSDTKFTITIDMNLL